MPLLDIENLSVGYRTRNGFLMAVDRVSFSLDAGIALGLVGESGCGKTTIGMSLMGLLPPNGEVVGGRVLFMGEDLLRKDAEELRRVRWSGISMIFQAAMNALNPVLRVEEQIVEAVLTHNTGMERAGALKRVERLFEMVGISADRMSDYPHQYSGGMKQRAVIAMALSCYPHLIIADEPTTALDVIVQHQILEELAALRKKLNLSMIFISHDISIVAEVCDRIGIMYAGQLVEIGDGDAVFGSPGHPYTRALLSSYPTLAGERRDLEYIPGETCNLIHPPAGCRFSERCPAAVEPCTEEEPSWYEKSPGHRVMCGRRY
jgi:peptide/nickel transport system ATP-binding protein